MGEAVLSPTPTLERTAREERRPAMLEEKAWRESFCFTLLGDVMSC